MSEIIPKEKLADFQRWQAGSFDSPKAAPAATPLATTRYNIGEATPQQTFALPTAEAIERMHEEAHAAGYQAGFEEGRLAAEQSARETADAQGQSFLTQITGLQQAIDGLDQNIAEQLLALATEIARQVIGGSIAVKNDLLLPIIREAIAALPIHHAHMSIRLNPADAARVRALLGEQLSQTGAQLIEDPEINLGGCLVRAGSSEVDATIETRWKRVLEAIGATPTAWLNP